MTEIVGRSSDTLASIFHTDQFITKPPHTMPTDSSKISEDKVLDHYWKDAAPARGTTCDIENCCTPGTTLTPQTAWSTTVGDAQTPRRMAYAGSNCIEKAIYTHLIPNVNATSDTVVTADIMARNNRVLDLAFRFKTRDASSAGAPTAATTGSLPEQDSKDHPSKD